MLQACTLYPHVFIDYFLYCINRSDGTALPAKRRRSTILSGAFFCKAPKCKKQTRYWSALYYTRTFALMGY